MFRESWQWELSHRIGTFSPALQAQEGSSPVFPQHRWQGGHLSLLSLLELMCTCRGDAEAQQRVSAGHRTAALRGTGTAAALLLPHCVPPGVTSEKVARLFPVKGCRAARRGVMLQSHAACCLT